MFPSHPTTGSARTMGRDQYEQFEQTRSRVIRIFNLPADASNVLGGAFGPGSAHRPASFWKLRDGDEHSVWAVFATHEEAAAALALSGANLSIATALDADLLSNLDKLKRVHHTRLSPPAPAMDDFAYGYTLSSNPPNPRHAGNAFRQGDWLCPQPQCAVHNFSRNVVCISCGGPRPALQPLPPQTVIQPPFLPPHQAMPSPRFVAAAVPGIPSPSPLAAAMQVASQKGQSLLTPSGRAFSVGGKVQNISTDPLAPCIIFWPDNEPLPEQGQIRPPMNGGVQPPILNTGNKGPIEHQPGDWVCQRCDYHNWRRRKVCQSGSYPFAEGNSDNVTAAAQQDRINLLASLLAQQHAAAQSGGIQFASPFLAAQATPTPPAFPPPPPPYQLPEPSPKSNVPGLLPLGVSPPGIPTPPNEPLDYGNGFASRSSVSAAVQASRLTRFASTPSLRAHWPPAQAQAQQLTSSSASSPQRTPLSASYLQTTHQIGLGHRPPPLAPVSIGHHGTYSAGPASAKSDSFSFASSSSDFELPPIPPAPGTRTVSGPLLGGRPFGSVAALSLSHSSGAVCPPPRHTASLDLDAFHLGLRLDDDGEGTLLEGEEGSRPGTGTSHSHSLTGTGSSRSSVDSPQVRAIGSLPDAHAGLPQSFWARGPEGRAASIAALTPWSDPTRSPRMLERGLNVRLGPIGSGRSVGGSGSSPTSAKSAASISGQGSYVLVNIG
ncbi:hypothetical protein AURDEDRAFT_185801 [Auricularia subglabra TFB-10046 SS5]|nr:hypothetical protein AURDEDRAFT_185801 [Auricularia subglabra TFB-10046 SS5]